MSAQPPPARSFPLSRQVEVPCTHWDGELAADFGFEEGLPVLAPFDGVATAQDWPDGGHTVSIRHESGWVAYLAHLAPRRATGPVRAGQVIGSVSRSGSASADAPHLHMAVGRVITPRGGGEIRLCDWLRGTTPQTSVLIPLHDIKGPHPLLIGGAFILGLVVIADVLS